MQYPRSYNNHSCLLVVLYLKNAEKYFLLQNTLTKASAAREIFNLMRCRYQPLFSFITVLFDVKSIHITVVTSK